MKLRIKGNSLRLRVAPSEVPRLLKTGRIEETIHFGPQKDSSWTYDLEHADLETEISLRHQPGEVAVLLSTPAARAWAGSDQVAIEAILETGQGPLTLLVEKDFACLDQSDQDNEDTFPNPNSEGPC